MKNLFEALYKSEINLHISWFWDAGFDVKIGDEMNGYLASFSSYDLFEIEKWIEQKAKELFPDSKFSKTYKKEINEKKEVISETTFYIRRVENGLILNANKEILVFGNDEELQKHLADRIVLPQGTEHEYKFRITVE